MPEVHNVERVLNVEEDGGNDVEDDSRTRGKDLRLDYSQNSRTVGWTVKAEVQESQKN